MKNYTLIGFPRTGTAWFKYHFREYYGNSNYLGEYFSKFEYTHIENNVYYKVRRNQSSQRYSKKISFLNSERINNNEYYIKYMVHHINELDENFPNWWNEFYKDYEKIKVLNKNVWRIFLSNSYQDYTKWKKTGNWKVKNFKLEKFYTSFEYIQIFCKLYNDYINFDRYDVLFDVNKIDNDFVMNYLNNNTYVNKPRYIHDYEKYLISDIDLVKEELKKELKKYNLEFLDNGKIL